MSTSSFICGVRARSSAHLDSAHGKYRKRGVPPKKKFMLPPGSLSPDPQHRSRPPPSGLPIDTRRAGTRTSIPVYRQRARQKKPRGTRISHIYNGAGGYTRTDSFCTYPLSLTMGGGAIHHWHVPQRLVLRLCICIHISRFLYLTYLFFFWAYEMGTPRFPRFLVGAPLCGIFVVMRGEVSSQLHM
ncbi:hypothetical protein BJV74DRAFT_34310 [Russula compacta]|nr:hypothetical protein BJV74DRAFT_34310 [Russula compacta]